MATLAGDLGGTWIRAAIVSEHGTLERVGRHRLRSVFDGRDASHVWDEIVERIGDYAAARRDEIERVALAFPGPIAHGRPLVAPTLTGSTPVPADLVRRLHGRTRVPVRLVNDVAAATAFFAAKGRERSFFLVTVSSGIGSRVWHRGAARSVGRYDGEIGHLVIDNRDAAPACDCGGRGHLATFASGRGIERRARERASRYRATYAASALGRSGARPRELTNEHHLVPAMLSGDRWSLELLRAAVAPLARLALQVVVASGLQRCYVIGGFATALGPVYRDVLIDSMNAILDVSPITLDPKALVRVVPPEAEPVLRGAVLAP